MKAVLLGSATSATIEIWFQDEARVGQKGGRAYIWAEVGSRPPMVVKSLGTATPFSRRIVTPVGAGDGALMKHVRITLSELWVSGLPE